MRRAPRPAQLAPALLAFLLAGCSWWGGAPEEPGLYAVVGDEDPQRLNGSPEWERETWPERQNLPPDTRFMVRLPETAKAAGQPRVGLSKVGWVRSEIRSGSEIGPPQGRRWVNAPLAEFAVPLRVVHRKADVVMLAPQQGKLEPGLYSLQIEAAGTRLQARFGVGWSGIDEKRYAASHCMDRYVEKAGAQYRPCAQQRVAVSTEGLQIRLVNPDRQAMGDKLRLVVKGTIANVSEQARAVPGLQGELKDRSGRVVHRWQFASPTEKLEPGGYVPFTTVANGVPSTATDVTVRFQPYSRSASQ